MFATIVEDAIIELRILGENNFQSFAKNVLYGRYLKYRYYLYEPYFDLF